MRSVVAVQNAYMVTTNPRHEVTGKEAATQNPQKARSQAVMEPSTEMSH